MAAACVKADDQPATGARGDSATPTTMTGDSLSFTAQVPESARPGESVVVRLRLANVAERPLEVHLQGRETVFDVVVSDERGNEVWRRLEGQATLSILQLRPLAPGEAIEFMARWSQEDRRGNRVPPGSYRIVGELPGDGPAPLRTAPATLQINSGPSVASPGAG